MVLSGTYLFGDLVFLQNMVFQEDIYSFSFIDKNILLDVEGYVMLTDFGLEKEVNESM